MGFIRHVLSFAAEVAVDLLGDDARGSDDADDEEGLDGDVFYDPNGAAHAHLLDPRGIPMDPDWFDGKH